MRKSKRAWKIKMIILSLSLYIYTINSMKRVRKLSEYRNKPGSRYAIFQPDRYDKYRCIVID